MRKIARTLAIVLLMSFFASFTAFGFNEGRALITDRENYDIERVYCYIYEDGHFARNEWKFIADDWYYFKEDKASEQNAWAEIDGKWYHFDSFSKMQHDTTIDGHKLGSDGVWVPADDEAVPVQETATNN